MSPEAAFVVHHVILINQLIVNSEQVKEQVSENLVQGKCPDEVLYDFSGFVQKRSFIKRIGILKSHTTETYVFKISKRE